MKKLLFTLMILVASQMLTAQSDTINDSTITHNDSIPIHWQRWNTGIEKVRLANFEPTRTVKLISDSTEFIITFDYDSLKVSGDMPMDEAAKIFINYCEQYFYTKIDSLQEEIDKLIKP